MNFDQIHWNMNVALEEAEKAYRVGEVPIGAVMMSSDGKIIAQTHNFKETGQDPTAHAEILAIREASQRLKRWRLNECSLFVTLEPCPMCLFALMQARIKTLYFGAYDPKGGSFSLGYHLQKDQRFNHTFDVVGGVEQFKCSQILTQFFRERRGGYNLGKNE